MVAMLCTNQMNNKLNYYVMFQEINFRLEVKLIS